MNWQFITHVGQFNILPYITVSLGYEDEDGTCSDNLVIFFGWLIFTITLEFER